MTKPLLMVFLRAPVKGRVKTRLAATLGEDRALEVYLRLMHHTLREAADLRCAKQAWYADEVPDPDPCAAHGFTCHVQAGDDLGHRMRNAFAAGFASGYGPVVIIGTDLPGLSSELLQAAFDAMRDHDAVIGPTHDGGYYLLGLHEPLDALFRDKLWSTSTVFAQTRLDLALNGKTCGLLPTLADVDTEADLNAVGLP